MKTKWVWLLLLVCSNVWADVKEELVSRINQLNGFSADFQQKVISPEGDVLLEGTGKVDIRHPDFFRWQTKTPEDTLLVSDGKAIWYYHPFIEQVTIFNQDQIVNQTPFILLMNDAQTGWESYSLSRTGDTFTLAMKTNPETRTKYEVKVNAQGLIQAFSVLEPDGQQSHFTFSRFSTKVPPKNTFKFTMPEGVEVDDQR